MVQIDAPDPASSAASGPAAISPATAPVAPPRRPLVVGSEPVDSQEITQGDLLADEDIAAAAGPSSANGGFTTAGPPPPAPDLLDSQAIERGGAADDQNHPAAWHANSNWASESTRKSRQRLLIGIAIVGGLLIFGILAMWLFSGDNTQETIAEHSLAAPVAENPGPEIDPVAATTPPPNPLVDASAPESSPSERTDPVAAANTVAAANAAAGQDTAAAAQDTAAGQDTAAAQDSLAVNDTDAVNNTAATTLNTDNAAMNAGIPTNLLPVDVLGTPSGDTRMNPRGNTGAVVPGQPDEPAADPLMDLPPELAAFVDLLDLPGNAPDAPPVTPSDVPADDLVVDQAADAMLDPMLLATPPPEVNIDNALKLRVAIQTGGYPLASFVLFCSELTQVPIQMDWFTLDLAGVSLSQPVRDPQPGWKPIGSLMDQIGSRAGVVFEQEKTRLLLTLAIPDLQARMKAVLATDDFGDEQASVRPLVERFVDHPEWNEREQLNLRAIVTDCLRLARGLESKLPALALSHWTIRSNALVTGGEASDPSKGLDEQWPLVEGGQSGPQLDTAITLAGLLRQTSQVNQVTCVVNWDDARQRRLTPGQLVLPYADQPAGQMLAQTLAPMGLQARVADEKHWWVGTAATYDRMPLLVIGDELGPQREEILARIREAAARADTLIFIEHDPVSDRYISMMPRFLYRQLPTILRPFSRPPPVE